MLAGAFGALRSPVLDVGSAWGRNSRALADAGHSVVAIEINPVLVERFRSGSDLSVTPLVRGDATRMSLRDGAFNSAVAVEVLEHVSDPAAMVAELSRVLDEGATLCLAIPTGYSERLLGRLHPRYRTNAGHLTTFGRTQVETLLAEHGFRVDRVEVRNLGPLLGWVVHALLRSDADDTGEVFEHHWVDRTVHLILAVWRRAPVWRRALRWLEARVGKSWYFFCTRVGP